MVLRKNQLRMGSFLKEKRKEKGLSQQKVSEELQLKSRCRQSALGA